MQLLVVLSMVDEWGFDSFSLSDVSAGRPLSTLAFALFKRSGLIQILQIDESILAR